MRTQVGRGSDDRDRVLDASDIVRVVGEHIALRPKGREFVGLCPFHDDRTPSMYVVPHKQIFYCFACGAGGNVLTFVQRYHKMEFREALEFLADRAGVQLAPRRQSAGPAPAASRRELVAVNAAAAEFFRAVMRHGEHGRVARRVAQERQLDAQMLDRFGIGAAPDRFDGLLTTLGGRGVGPDLLLAAGLVKRRADGSHYDAFRDRLMFPIRDQLGRVIGFGGRRLGGDADQPKYINTPETLAFDKSSTLYGLHEASRAIQDQRTAVVTEGYLDVIACHRAGIENVVGTLGTALTRRHGSILRRLGDTVVMLFDGDEAGLRAADRAVEVFFAESIDVRIATLASHTDAKDPDELLARDGGADTLRAVIASAVDLLAYRFARARERLAGKGISAIGRAIEEEIARLVELGLNELPPVRRQLVVRHVAALAGVDEAAVLKSIPRGRRTRSSEEERPQPPTLALSPLQAAVGALVVDPSAWGLLDDDARAALRAQGGSDARLAAIVEAVADGAATTAAVLGRLDDPDAAAVATSLAHRVDPADQGAEHAAVVLRDGLRLMRADAAGTPSPEQSVADAIARVRERRGPAGGDPRVLPRPIGVGPGSGG